MRRLDDQPLLAMMLPSQPLDTPTRHDLWERFADHFLDSETRPTIPSTAAACVAAGLPTSEAFDIWRFEVTPAVWSNVYDLTGQWGAWPREWLVRRIEEVGLTKRSRTAGVPANIVYRSRVHWLHRIWGAIAACIELLQTTVADRRDELTADLTWLAGRFFDAEHVGRATSQPRLARLYPTVFMPVFGPLVVTNHVTGESPLACHRRIVAVLGELAP